MSALNRMKLPRKKQRSEMTPEEQLANPEEGAQEQGWLETAEDALTQGRDNYPGAKMGAVSIGRIEGAAESLLNKGAKALESKLIKQGIQPGRAAEIAGDIGESVRATGKYDIMEAGKKLEGTIGAGAPGVQETVDAARLLKKKQMEKTPGFVYDRLGRVRRTGPPSKE